MRWFLVLLTIFLCTTRPVFAAKKRIRVSKAAGVSYSAAHLSRPTHSVLISLFHLDKTKRVDYLLDYIADGIEQGAMGTILPTGQTSDSRDIYFGTCSKGVCTPHYHIRNATLTITTTLRSGATYIKRYHVKI